MGVILDVTIVSAGGLRHFDPWVEVYFDGDASTRLYSAVVTAPTRWGTRWNANFCIDLSYVIKCCAAVGQPAPTSLTFSLSESDDSGTRTLGCVDVSLANLPDNEVFAEALGIADEQGWLSLRIGKWIVSSQDQVAVSSNVSCELPSPGLTLQAVDGCDENRRIRDGTRDKVEEAPGTDLVYCRNDTAVIVGERSATDVSAGTVEELSIVLRKLELCKANNTNEKDIHDEKQVGDDLKPSPLMGPNDFCIKEMGQEWKNPDPYATIEDGGDVTTETDDAGSTTPVSVTTASDQAWCDLDKAKDLLNNHARLDIQDDCKENKEGLKEKEARPGMTEETDEAPLDIADHESKENCTRTQGRIDDGKMNENGSNV